MVHRYQEQAELGYGRLCRIRHRLPIVEVRRKYIAVIPPAVPNIWHICEESEDHVHHEEEELRHYHPTWPSDLTQRAQARKENRSTP